MATEDLVKSIEREEYLRKLIKPIAKHVEGIRSRQLSGDVQINITISRELISEYTEFNEGTINE